MKSKPTIRRALPLFIGGLALSGLAHGQVSITTAYGNGADGSLQNDGNRASNFVDNGSIKSRYAPNVRMKVGMRQFLRKRRKRPTLVNTRIVVGENSLHTYKQQPKYSDTRRRCGIKMVPQSLTKRIGTN